MWANILGIAAASLAAIQYLPQIWTTYARGDVGSLSIPMMVIQTPGSFVWAGSLAARLGLEGWSTWGVYLITGCLQGCLLIMGIAFELKKRRELEQLIGPVESGVEHRIEADLVSDQHNGDTARDETTPLLNKSRKAAASKAKISSGHSE